MTRNVEEVNNLNVFPVPDGDTGTNMLSTIGGASSVNADGLTLGEYSEKVAGAMMRASRGNSGVILSLFFRGLAKVFAGRDEADAGLILSAMRTGAVSAASAVAKPVEGTILTVMRECCAGEFSASDTSDLSALFAELIVRAEDILAKTPEMLPALKRARVVDSGGMGFVLILKGMKAALEGEIDDVPAVSTAAPAAPVSAAGSVDEEIVFAFCTECMLRKSPDAVQPHPELREKLSEVGDSMVYVEDDEILKLHIHTNIPLDVLSWVSGLGTFEKCKIENMRFQHSELMVPQTAAPEVKEKEKEKEKPEEKLPRTKYAIVAVYDGNGMSDALHEAGASVTVNGGKSMNPSTDDILEAVKAANAETVFVLPNNKNTVMAAQQAAAILTGDIAVRVIPTHSVPEGIAAAMAYNASRSPDDNEKHMKAAAKEITSLSVARAVRPAETAELSIKKNQYIGLVNGSIRVAEDTLPLAIEKLIGKADSGDCYTVYYGAGLSAKEAAVIEEQIVALLPDADVSMLFGGQKIYPLIISVE